MSCSDAFLVLDCAGLSIRADGNRLAVQPITLLTPELRALVRQHKAELLLLARDAEVRSGLAIERAARGSSRLQRILRHGAPEGLQ